MLEPDSGRVVVLGNMADAEPWDLSAYVRHDEAANEDGFNERRWYRMGVTDRQEPPVTFAGLVSLARMHRTQIALLAVVDLEAP
jgi:hypothetical protein